MDPGPLAISLDGRRFMFDAPVGSGMLQPGGYARIGDALGQVHDVRLANSERNARIAGDGVILARGAGGFHDAPVEGASPELVRTWLDGARRTTATLPFGELTLADGVPFALDAGGFDRHTFVCGQSGSGKTYALGGLLERLLLETGLRLVVLDPNSDHVRLQEIRDSVAPELAARYAGAAAGVAVRRPDARGADRLRLRFGRLEPRTQGALLRLDPVDDRGEYGALLDLVESADDDGHLSAEGFLEGSEAADALRARARNLGVLRWGVWAGDDDGSLDDDLASAGPSCVVIDLGGLKTGEEQALVAAATLETLWRQRADRRPTLIVIDEAHNVCPQSPADALTAIATDYAVRIAGEGRKFGLHLLVATQRPQKVHDNVLSQCDNLLLMRVNSLADLLHLEGAFSFVPPALVRLASSFRLGECLVAGRIASHPALVRVGPRLAEEGGADVSSDWARSRSA